MHRAELRTPPTVPDDARRQFSELAIVQKVKLAAVKFVHGSRRARPSADMAAESGAGLQRDPQKSCGLAEDGNPRQEAAGQLAMTDGQEDQPEPVWS